MSERWSAGRWVIAGIGAVAALYGVVGLATSLKLGNLVGWGLWFVGGAVLHDLLLAPLAAGIAVVVARVVPRRARPYVTGGLVVSAAVLAVASPLVARPGYDPALPSALPQDYGVGLLLVLGAVWVGVAVLALGRETSVGRRSHVAEAHQSAVVDDPAVRGPGEGP